MGIPINKSSFLRNPLTVFGLVLLAGDGPLVILFSLAKDSQQQWISLVATILFIFGMGTFFCYLVISKPRHLFAPDEIPKEAYDKPIYHEKIKDKVFNEAQELVENISKTESPEVRNKLAESLTDQLDIAQDFQTAYELLLIPGYDISLILEILDFITINKTLDYNRLSEPRDLTPSTIKIIEESMVKENLINKKSGKLFLSEKGVKLKNGLKKYLNN